MQTVRPMYELRRVTHAMDQSAEGNTHLGFRAFQAGQPENQKPRACHIQAEPRKQAICGSQV